MEIIAKNSAVEAAKFVARYIAKKVTSKKPINIGFATGRTMDAVYYHLCELSKEESLDFTGVRVFLLDEYIGLTPDNANLFRRYLDLHLIGKHNFKKDNIYVPDVFAADLDQAAREYEAAIREAGGLDLVLLGIGKNGHIAFNEPGSAADSRTRVVGLTTSTRDANRNAFLPNEAPLTALTIGIGTIMEAGECLLLATGESKAEIILKLANGDINSQVPATALKLHRNFQLVLDSDASKLI